MTDLYQILAGWMRLAHAGARRRSGAAFREAADMQELWASLVAVKSAGKGKAP